MPLTPSLLHDLADSVLGHVVNHYAAAGASAEPLPGRRYVAEGLVAIDCDQLSVRVARVYRGTPGAEVRDVVRQPLQLAADVEVQLVRCAAKPPAGKPIPTAAAIDAVARVVHADAHHLWEALRAGARAETLVGCQGLAFGDWRGVGPEGGFVGGLLSVGVALEAVP